MLRLSSRLMKGGAIHKFGSIAFRHYSSEVSENAVAPMFLRLRSELKTAMKAKDIPRRDVIKGVLANILNAEKNNQPIDTDEKIRKHLLKLSKSQKDVAQQFEIQKRNDLRDKELIQAAILDGYADEVKIASESELSQAIDQSIDSLKSAGDAINIGNIVKDLKRHDGSLNGVLFDSSQAIRLVKTKGY